MCHVFSAVEVWAARRSPLPQAAGRHSTIVPKSFSKGLGDAGERRTGRPEAVKNTSGRGKKTAGAV